MEANERNRAMSDRVIPEKWRMDYTLYETPTAAKLCEAIEEIADLQAKLELFERGLQDSEQMRKVLEAENTFLRTENAALKRPVSDAELAPYVLLIDDGYGHKGWFIDPEQVNVIIASRTQEAQKGQK